MLHSQHLSKDCDMTSSLGTFILKNWFIKVNEFFIKKRFKWHNYIIWSIKSHAGRVSQCLLWHRFSSWCAYSSFLVYWFHSILSLNIYSYKLCVMIIFYVFLWEEITQLTEKSFFACQQRTTECVKFLIHKDELEPLFSRCSQSSEEAN